MAVYLQLPGGALAIGCLLGTPRAVPGGDSLAPSVAEPLVLAAGLKLHATLRAERLPAVLRCRVQGHQSVPFAGNIRVARTGSDRFSAAAMILDLVISLPVPSTWRWAKQSITLATSGRIRVVDHLSPLRVCPMVPAGGAR